ncbi:MAG: hypothetical protein ACRC8F_06915 [Cetobacterium sp.]
MGRVKVVFLFIALKTFLFSVYQNTNPNRLVSKEAISIKGLVIDLKGTSEVFLDEEKVEIVQSIEILEEGAEIVLAFNHEDVQLDVEKNVAVDIDIVKNEEDSKFNLSFTESKEQIEIEEEKWRYVKVTAIYR